MEQRTLAAIAGITDEGLFERLATAVLRIAEPRCAGLSHPGLTPSGKTRRSPVDGVGYPKDEPDRLVLVQHTTAADLRAKWLLDPAKVKPRGGRKSEPVAGDLIKSLELVAHRRKRRPNLKATIYLTASGEVDEALLTEVMETAAPANLDVEIWTGSRLAGVLDRDRDGQWVRARLLGIDQQLLSADLLGELSRLSLDRYVAGDQEAKRTARGLDRDLRRVQRPLTLVTAVSGQGKTVACHRAVSQHVAAGGFGLVISHQLVERAVSIQALLANALVDLHPGLDAEGLKELVTPDRPLLVLVEDVSRSGEPGRLVDKLTRWLVPDERDRDEAAVRVLCPVWPQLLNHSDPNLESRRLSAILSPEPMTEDEARAAVKRAAELDGDRLTAHQAGRIASALAHDPLLIGLNEDWSSPDLGSVIETFLDRACRRAGGASSVSAEGAREGLGALGLGMLQRGALFPSWSDIQGWALSPSEIEGLARLIDAGEVLRMESGSGAPLRFRHDRVRSMVLVRAAERLFADGALDDDLVAEPALAEVFADLLVRTGCPTDLTGRVARLNPLAPFLALERLGAESPEGVRLIEAASDWLVQPPSRGRGYRALHWAAAVALMDVTGPGVNELIARLPEKAIPAQIARLRNGDIEGGLEICRRRGIHSAAAWLPEALNDHSEDMRDQVVSAIAEALDLTDDPDRISDCLQLAGVLGDPRLGDAVRAVWSRTVDRRLLLSDCLWAAARCATSETVEALLDPICALWATFPKSEGRPRPDNVTTIDDVAASDVCAGFGLLPPEGALAYFFARSRQPDLSWQIAYMLHSIDHPKVIRFLVEVLAAKMRTSPHGLSAIGLTSGYERIQWDAGAEPMSDASRAVLRDIWGGATDPHARKAAFDLWCYSRDPDDLAVLRALTEDPQLGDRALRARLMRGDHTAHPALALKLKGDEPRHWWHYARYAWSPVLQTAFEVEVDRYLADGDAADDRHDFNRYMVDVLVRMDRRDARRILLNYWERFAVAPRFIQTALFVGGPDLERRAAAAIRAHPDPSSLFEHLDWTWGFRISDHPGVRRQDQILALEPFLDLVGRDQLGHLSDLCNDHGWYDVRRRLLDVRVPAGSIARTIEEMLAVFRDTGTRRRIYDHHVDAALKAGLSRAQVVDAVRLWLAQAPARDALESAASVLQHVGNRSSGTVLDVWPGEDRAWLAEVRRDLDWVLQRGVLRS